MPSDFKYREDENLRELLTHVEATYGQHYVGQNNVQALDLIFATGHGEGFCIGSAVKYLSRYGKKDGKNRKDLMKAAHFILLALYLNDADSVNNEGK